MRNLHEADDWKWIKDVYRGNTDPELEDTPRVYLRKGMAFFEPRNHSEAITIYGTDGSSEKIEILLIDFI